ncbi:cytochrome c oxidase assembly protein [Mycetocola manganoxydans]|uniref:cytochrome c oxidase assembly protein n=1 Tax=Mycetocola manganoxydans TaxID=699879 RepID=UPI0011C3BCDB|nr:cytochrome c oxidase assembly protein [Mycetocola manganoxydans]
MSKLAFNVCAAVTIGALFFAAFVLPPSTTSHARSLRIALFAAGAWTMVSVFGLVFAFLSLVPMSLFDPGFFTQFVYFAQAIPLGQTWLVTILLTASISLIALLAQRPGHAAAGGALAVVALLPMALTGHAAGDQGHSTAVTALALHMLGAAVWLGGLIVLVAIRPQLNPDRLKVVIQRYSVVALSGFILVAASGVVIAVVQLNDVINLTTPYGLIVLAKAVVLVLLGGAGAWNRLRLIRRFGQPGSRAARTFWLVVGSELVLLGIASGLAAGLGRTPPPEQPIPANFPPPAEAVTGNPTPPEPSVVTLFTEWRLDPLWALVSVAALILYFLGVRQLRAQGRRWPVGRSVAWVLGLGLLFYATNGSVVVYQDYLVGFNVVSLLLICVMAPVALLAARPGTLVRSVVASRTDRTIGFAEAFVSAGRFSALRAISSPVLWAILLPFSFAVFLFTPLVEWSLREPFGYHLTIVCFLTLGVLLTRTVLQARTTRIALVAVGVFLIGMLVLALALYTHGAVLGAGWFLSLELDWRGGPLSSQQASSYLVAGVAVVWSAVLAATLQRPAHSAQTPTDVPLAKLTPERTS